MIERLSRQLDAFVRRWMPDPFVLAIGLTFVVVLAGILVAEGNISEKLITTLGGWKAFIFEPPTASGGINRKLLYFAFQMCLMLVTGHALAASPPVANVVRHLARLPKTFPSAITLVSLVACIMALIHWGLGLIVGAMIAREVGRELSIRKIPHHYPLLGAAGYTGLMVWGGGLSGSIPLAAADQAGIDISQTVFSTLNLVTSAALVLTVAIVSRLIIPKDITSFVPFTNDDEESEATLDVAQTPAQRLNQSRTMVFLLCAMALGYLSVQVLQGKAGLSFNNLNFSFLFLGLLFHGTPIRYVRAINTATRGCAGIILQFPLYFGILGILVTTGLAEIVTNTMVTFAGETIFPIVTYFSAGFVNLFVPSGGGQWILQGKIVMDGAQALGDSALLSKSVMALTYGDAWTNMLQPFWAVPLLAITGLRARDIIGYTATIMLAGGLVTVTCLWVV